MQAGFNHSLPAQIRVYTGGLRFLRQYSGGLRYAGFKYKLKTLTSTSKTMDGRRGLIRRWSFLFLLGREGRGEVMEQVRGVSRYLLRTVARQSEVHTSQKLRRALQLYSTHSRLWGEEAARNMFASLRRTLASKGRNILLSAVCFSNFNWESERISNERMQESTRDLESVEDLCRATIKCESCGKRQVIDQEMANIEYCRCSGSLGYTDNTREYESWRPFIEREHHIVWRQRHHKHNHLFAYKVYGSYQDVSLSSFMETQLSCEYRTEWDDSALQLKVLNSDKDSNSDLVYWLVKFPHFFANRDYLFKRRFYVNREKREVVIMSEAVSDGVMAEEKGVHRVNEYWSTMVIRALGDIDKPGIEYTLTYFDNPGTSLPQSITNFIAVTGFPNFLKKLHTAAMQLQSFYEQGEDVYVSLPDMLRYPDRQQVEEPELDIAIEDLKEGSDVVREVGMSSVENLEDLHEEGLDVLSVTSDMDVCEDANMDEVENTSDVDVTTSTDETMTTTTTATTTKTSDKSLQITISGKNISVDLLEAMEIVAPELEKKSVLMRKIEDLNERLRKNGRQSVLLEELSKLRHKLKSFREQATIRKEKSLKQMEQISTRDHYNHMGIDENTLTQLEMLFEAMRYVLHADKDMRTGKTLLSKTVKEKRVEIKDFPTIHKQDSAKETKYTKQTISQTTTDTEAGETPLNITRTETPSDIRDSETTHKKDWTEGSKEPKQADISTSKAKRKDHKHQPPKDPPPPPPPPPEIRDWREEDKDDRAREESTYAKLGSIVSNVYRKMIEDSNSSSSSSSSSIKFDKEVDSSSRREKGTCTESNKSNSLDSQAVDKVIENNTVNGVFESEKRDESMTTNDLHDQELNKSSWFGGLSIPYISAWWEGKDTSEKPTNQEENNAIRNPSQTSTLSQIYHIVSLGWMYGEERDETRSTGGSSTREMSPESLKIEENQTANADQGTSALSQIYYVLSLNWIYGERTAKEGNLIKEEEGEVTVVEEEKDAYGWYWYPLKGMYRVFAWITSTKMSA